jgi:hypothetical protein
MAQAATVRMAYGGAVILVALMSQVLDQGMRGSCAASANGADIPMQWITTASSGIPRCAAAAKARV